MKLKQLFCKHIFYTLEPLVEDGTQGLAEKPTDTCTKCGAKRKYWSKRDIEKTLWWLIKENKNYIKRRLDQTQKEEDEDNKKHI